MHNERRIRKKKNPCEFLDLFFGGTWLPRCPIYRKPFLQINSKWYIGATGRWGSKTISYSCAQQHRVFPQTENEENIQKKSVE